MDCAAHVHVAAWHAEPGYRAATPGLGVLCRRGDGIGGAGAFSNSIGRASGYAALGLQPWRIGSVRVGAFGGVITGYQRRAQPFGAVFLSLPAPWGDAHVAITPAVGRSPLTVALSFSF